jgi:hypothetical protein
MTDNGFTFPYKAVAATTRGASGRRESILSRWALLGIFLYYLELGRHSVLVSGSLATQIWSAPLLHKYLVADGNTTMHPIPLGSVCGQVRHLKLLPDEEVVDMDIYKKINELENSRISTIPSTL